MPTTMDFFRIPDEYLQEQLTGSSELRIGASEMLVLVFIGRNGDFRESTFLTKNYFRS